MIEHIQYHAGLNMLQECYRILCPGGVIRISTPDLSFLWRLHQDHRTKIENDYITWSINEIPNAIKECGDVFVINNYVRAWGHQFIYDEKTLKASLEYAGFRNIKQQKINHSEHEHSTGLENEARMPDGFLELESLILEGTKN